MTEGILRLDSAGHPQSGGWATAREAREDRRFPLRLRVAVVYHRHRDEATRPTYHGYTNELSVSGLSVIVDHNVFSEDEVTVLLAIPPEHHGVPKKVVEATVQMIYTVYSPDHDAFRIGMAFKDFKEDGPQLLTEYVQRRMVKYDCV